MYETLKELLDAISNGVIDPATLTGFICKGELFVRAGTPKDVFSAYYGSAGACEDVCAALGIKDIEHV
jgi:hypothetical protein